MRTYVAQRWAPLGTRQVIDLRMTMHMIDGTGHAIAIIARSSSRRLQLPGLHAQLRVRIHDPITDHATENTLGLRFFYLLDRFESPSRMSSCMRLRCLVSESRNSLVRRSHTRNVLNTSAARFASTQKPPIEQPSPTTLAAFPTATNTNSMTFIDRVKVYGAQIMLGTLVTSEKFDRTLNGLTVTGIDTTAGTVTCELVVDTGLQNTYGTLHGGAIATIVDVVGTMALLAKDHLRAGVSVEMNISYLAAAKAGEKVLIHGRVLKTGKRLGFSEVTITRQDGTLLATGRHTKAL